MLSDLGTVTYGSGSITALPSVQQWLIQHRSCFYSFAHSLELAARADDPVATLPPCFIMLRAVVSFSHLMLLQFAYILSLGYREVYSFT